MAYPLSSSHPYLNKGYSLIHDATQLRSLIANFPDLPIVVLADEDSAGDWSAWTYCSSVRCEISQLLDISTPYDEDGEKIFTDQNDFEEAIVDYWQDAEPDYSGDEIDLKVKTELEKYKPYWRSVIAIYASN